LADPSLQNTIGSPFIELQSVDSTNNYALTQVHAGLARHGSCFFAHEQTAGKGQRGKVWTAERDSSIITSIVIDPSPLTLVNQFHLSACVAVSACECLEKYTGDEVRVKWPNDVYWQDRKAGGILIENVIGDQTWGWAVIGIGINVNQERFSQGLTNPVSIKQITGKSFDPLSIAKELYSILNKNWNELSSNGFNKIYSSYQQRLYKKDQQVRFKKDNRSFQGIVKNVSPSGLLVVQHAIEEEFRMGELEWML
jgi:BirA family transcriptional regulator, biotin operon repressor / biotin---[acetyl-CoA-carboxylase] ligase